MSANHSASRGVGPRASADVRERSATRARRSSGRRSAGVGPVVAADPHRPEHLEADLGVALGSRRCRLAADEVDHAAPRLRERARHPAMTCEDRCAHHDPMTREPGVMSPANDDRRARWREGLRGAQLRAPAAHRAGVQLTAGGAAWPTGASSEGARAKSNRSRRSRSVPTDTPCRAANASWVSPLRSNSVIAVVQNLRSRDIALEVHHADSIRYAPFPGPARRSRSATRPRSGIVSGYRTEQDAHVPGCGHANGTIHRHRRALDAR